MSNIAYLKAGSKKFFAPLFTDREDSLRRKGPSKENRQDPIAGMGLLPDTDQVPAF